MRRPKWRTTATRRRGGRRRSVHGDTEMTTESERDVIDRGVVRGTESDATDIENVHGRATGGETMCAMTGADTDHEVATISDETNIQNAGETAMSMRSGRGHYRETGDGERTREAGHHTRGVRGGGIEECSRYSEHILKAVLIRPWAFFRFLPVWCHPVQAFMRAYVALAKSLRWTSRH